MATQTIEFAAVSGRSLVARLFPLGSDAQTSTDKAAVEQTNRKGLYLASWTDAPAGDYTLHAFDTETERVVAVQRVKLSLTDGTFREWSDAMLQGIFDKPGAELTPEQIAAIAADVIAELGTSGVTVSGFLAAALGAIRNAVAGAVIRPDAEWSEGELTVWLGDRYGSEFGRPITRTYSLSAVPWLEAAPRNVELLVADELQNAAILDGSATIAGDVATVSFTALNVTWGHLRPGEGTFRVIQRFPDNAGGERQTLEGGRCLLLAPIPSTC